MLELLHDYWLYFLVGRYPEGPLGGLALTVLLASLALVLSLPLGLLLGLARLSPWRLLRWPVAALIHVVRGIPLLLVIAMLIWIIWRKTSKQQTINDADRILE